MNLGITAIRSFMFPPHVIIAAGCCPQQVPRLQRPRSFDATVLQDAWVIGVKDFCLPRIRLEAERVKQEGWVERERQRCSGGEVHGAMVSRLGGAKEGERYSGAHM